MTLAAPVTPATLLEALLTRGFSLIDAARALNLSAVQLLDLASDPAFRDRLRDLRSLTIELAHLHALSILQQLTLPRPDPDPVEQRRACAAILRFRNPETQPETPPADTAHTDTTPAARPPIQLPDASHPDAFMADLIDALGVEPADEDDPDDPDTLDDPASPTGRALLTLHACLAAHGPGATLDGREVPADPRDFLESLDPGQARALTNFAGPLYTVEEDTPTRHTGRLVMPRRGGGECNYRRFTLTRESADLPWRLRAVEPYNPARLPRPSG